MGAAEQGRDRGATRLRAMQTEFAEQVGKPVGLQRGIEGSKAEHNTAKEYNAAMKRNPLMAPPKPPVPTFTDKVSGKAKEMEETYQEEWAAHVKQVERAQ